jgi:hypothetical protein
MDKYLARVNASKALKEEIEQKKAKVFTSGKNWTRDNTEPQTPKLSAGLTKGDRNFEETVGALHKPVAPNDQSAKKDM